MCGIFAYCGKKSAAAEIVFAGLKSLEYRGYDSWGIAAIISKTSLPYVQKAVGKIGSATITIPQSHLALGHTRWATHGGVTKQNAHPHLDCSKKIVVVHNGIVENYEQLKAQLQKNDHVFTSETDTEIIAHLIEEFCQTKNFVDSVGETFKRLSGANAFVALSQKNHTLVAIRNSSPLVIGFGNKEFFIASDSAALLAYTKTVYFLKHNELISITPDKVALFNVDGYKAVRLKSQTLNWNNTQTNKGAFAHFMLKEIYEQPEVIRKIVGGFGLDEVNKLAMAIKKMDHVYILGCGTAYHAAVSSRELLSMIAAKEVTTCLASEFAPRVKFLNKKSLVIALSQSGETMDTLIAINQAKAKGATIASLVNVEGSSLTRESDITVLIGAGPEKAVASTKAFTAKLAHVLLLAYALNNDIASGKKLLRQAAYITQEIVANPQPIKELAQQLKQRDHLYVIGRGNSLPIALEIALKIKEISYIHAEGLAAGELKHGTLALITEGTPCLVLAPKDQTYEETINSALEMKARGGFIIGVSSKPHAVFDYFLKVADAKAATIIGTVVAGQLLAYYLATARNLDPDMPRNLAKSVTVK